jgi:hypothetical protein
MSDKQSVCIGIDPGVKTGLAVWDRNARKLARVSTMTIIDAMDLVREYAASGSLYCLYFEDARLRTGYFGERAGINQQGAGSIKRDCGIWDELSVSLACIPFKPLSPQQKGRKVGADAFVKLTGWTARTSEHGRDAAMLVWGR